MMTKKRQISDCLSNVFVDLDNPLQDNQSESFRITDMCSTPHTLDDNAIVKLVEQMEQEHCDLNYQHDQMAPMSPNLTQMNQQNQRSILQFNNCNVTINYGSN